MNNIIASELQIRRTLHCMVPYFTSGDSSSCNIFLLKTIWVFLCGHFMSRAAMWGTVSCKNRFNYEVGEFGRKVCMPGSVCCLKLIDVETPGLASGLQPGSNVRKAHCAAAEKPGALSCVYSTVRDCRHASDHSAAPFFKNTRQNQMEAEPDHPISPTMSSLKLPPN